VNKSSGTRDVIVVGARCAGASVGMLLARRGYDVLVVDRAHFPSDTVSTHLVHPPGVRALDRWGLHDECVALGAPPINRYAFDFGAVTVAGSPCSRDDDPPAYCPRRTVLDMLLVDAARRAGAEVREGVTVDDVVFERDAAVVVGHTRTGGVEERSRVVIGADGAHSRVAKIVGAPSYAELPVLSVGYYAYWSGVPVDDVCWMIRPGCGIGAFPTNDDLTLLVGAWPHAEYAAVKRDIDGRYTELVEQAFGDRLEGAQREGAIVGGGVPNRFRKPYGRGWALVGDAGYVKDPVTAQGITDAFLDAELCAESLDLALRAVCSFDDAMRDYHEARDARVQPLYDFTVGIADLAAPPSPELPRVLGAIHDDQEAMDDFAGVFAGTVSPRAFFDPANIDRLIGANG
jgi:flavin-dependent dehydrogenase